MSKKIDGGGLRHNKGKPRVDLVPPSTVLAMAGVMEEGAKKYAPHNWRRGMKWSTVLASLERHLLAFKGGEDYDQETGKSHPAHILTNAAFLVEYMETCTELDDRYKVEESEEVPEVPNKVCFGQIYEPLDGSRKVRVASVDDAGDGVGRIVTFEDVHGILKVAVVREEDLFKHYRYVGDRYDR